jgi:hypothetical protein
MAACGAAPREQVPDAGPIVNERAVPISVTGTTPFGPLEGFAFATAYYYNCDQEFRIELRTTRFVTDDPRIDVSLRMPEDTAAPVTGSLEAKVAAWQFDTTETWTVMSYAAATFDAVTLDPPRSDGRMSGTVIATAPGWMLDFYVDLPFVQVSSNHGGCTI